MGTTTTATTLDIITPKLAVKKQAESKATDSQAQHYIFIGAKANGIKIKCLDFIEALQKEGYHIVAKVGRGAFATVFQVRNIKSGHTDLALKICAGTEAKRCFDRELEALKRFTDFERRKHRNNRCRYLPRLKNSFTLLLDGFIKCSPTINTTDFNNRATDYKNNCSDIEKDIQQIISSSGNNSSKTTTTTTTPYQQPNPQPLRRPNAKCQPATIEVNCLVTKYYNYGNLRSYLNKNGPLAATKCFRWFNHISEAVARAHDYNVAHCDIKLDNIMLTRDKHTKEIYAVLCDWGLSESAQPRHVLSARGTLPYSPPEVARVIYERLRIRQLPPAEREAAEFKRRLELKSVRPFSYDGFTSDSWALGVCLWSMGVGLHPFDGHNLAKTMRHINNFELLLAEHRVIFSSSTTRPVMAKDFWDTVELLVRRNPKDRYRLYYNKQDYYSHQYNRKQPHKMTTTLLPNHHAQNDKTVPSNPTIDSMIILNTS